MALPPFGHTLDHGPNGQTQDHDPDDRCRHASQDDADGQQTPETGKPQPPTSSKRSLNILKGGVLQPLITHKS